MAFNPFKSPSNNAGSDYSLDESGATGIPLGKETDEQFGGNKPGKAPTLKYPKAPDPYKLIEEQAKVNRPNVKGPLRNTSFTKGADGYWTEETQFSPELQGLFDQRIGMVGEDLPLYDTPDDASFGAEGDKLSDSIYKKYESRLNPQFEKEQSDLTSQLANQGITQGSEAYTKAMDDLGRRKKEAYGQAGLESVGAGKQEQGRLYTQGMQSREQGFRQNISRRQQLYNELASLMGTAQIGKPTELDVTGPFTQQYQGQMANVNQANQAGQQKTANNASAGASIASLLVSAFSDRRLKTDIEQVGKLPSGLNVYSYRYLWEETPRIGVMADEVEKVFPEAVGEMYGYQTVDYSRIH